MHEALRDALARGRSRRRMPGAPPHRRRPRLLRRARTSTTGCRDGRRDAGARRARSKPTTIRWCASCARCPFRSSPPSTASPPAPAPISRSPATSCWRRARRASSRPSPRSASCPIPAAPGSCRGSIGPARARGAGAHRRAAARGEGGGLGPDLEGGRRRRADGRSAQALRPLRRRADGRARPDQARARRNPGSNDLDAQLDLERELQREASLHARLCRGRARVSWRSVAPVFTRTQRLVGCILRAVRPFQRGGIWMNSATCSLVSGASRNLSRTASVMMPSMSRIGRTAWPPWAEICRPPSSRSRPGP